MQCLAKTSDSISTPRRSFLEHCEATSINRRFSKEMAQAEILAVLSTVHTPFRKSAMLRLGLQMERVRCLPQSTRKAFAIIEMQTPSAIPSTGIATTPKNSARGSVATHAVNDIGRGLSGFEAMGRSPIGPPTTNFLLSEGVSHRARNDTVISEFVYWPSGQFSVLSRPATMWPRQSRGTPDLGHRILSVGPVMPTPFSVRAASDAGRAVVPPCLLERLSKCSD
jgi:hypothetical protein